MAMHTCKYKN